MKTELHRRVLEAIRRQRMILPGDRVGVAVSGGADSVGLLRLLEDLRGELGISLSVLHLNHALRGEESDADEQFVATLASESGHDLIAGREDVAALARRHGWNLEDAARRMRQAFFARAVQERRVDRVAVGHTADDQAETVLGRLIRGTGPGGLAGIYPVLQNIVRPLLEIRRQELREYLIARGQSWREDSTNLDLRRLRNRLRRRFLPELEREFSSAVVERLGTLASLARADQFFWDTIVEDRFWGLVHETHGARRALAIRVADLLAPLKLADSAPIHPDRTDANPASLALAQRLIRRILAGLQGDEKGLTHRHVQDVIHLASHCSSGHRVELPEGLMVERIFDRLVFSSRLLADSLPLNSESSSDGSGYEMNLELPPNDRTISIPEIGKRFSLKVIDWPMSASDTRYEGAALDADRLLPPLVLRNWRPGDAYRPRGRRRILKLKHMFTRGRIEARERAWWPVLTSAGRVVWTWKMPPAAECSAGESTRSVLWIAEEGQ